jgi:hypothetical protein
MGARTAVLRELGPRYRKASKKERGAILDEVVELCGYSRAYAARRLCHGVPQEPHRHKIGIGVAVEALRMLKERGELDPDEILHFARVCRVENVMKPYLQALTCGL